MSRLKIPLLAASLALAACEQQGQQLPFDLAGAEVTQTVSPTGGTVSTAQGASVTFPAGAVAQATSVTVAPLAQPASTASGTPVGTASFRLAPEGTALQKPAEVTLRLGDNPADAWLASVLNLTPSGPQEIGSTDVDLSAGLVRAKVSTLGTLTAVLPEEDAVVRAESLAPANPAAGVSARLSAAGAASTAQVATGFLEGRCGEAGSRCRIKVQASESLRELVQGIAVVFPKIHGRIVIDGSRASGKITLSGTIKTKIGKVGNGATVEVTVEPTASTVVSETAGEVVLSDVRVTASGAGMQGAESLTLRFRHNGAQEAWFEVTRSDIQVGDKSHTVRLVLPLVRG